MVIKCYSSWLILGVLPVSSVTTSAVIHLSVSVLSHPTSPARYIIIMLLYVSVVTTSALIHLFVSVLSHPTSPARYVIICLVHIPLSNIIVCY